MTNLTNLPSQNGAPPTGLDIKTTVQRLRRYVALERRSLKILAGWFLCAPAYEIKYALGYHLWDGAEHTNWIRARLSEMRGGHAEASVEPALRLVMEEALHAPDTDAMLRGLYGVIKRDLLRAYQEHLQNADPVANAAETRLLQRLIPALEAQLVWYDGLNLEEKPCEWQDYIRALLKAAGGASGAEPMTDAPPSAPPGARFERSRTIVFDERIRRGELTAYEERQEADARTATIEQFKVFFNEFYAAALLASILFDAFEDGLPWEFTHDFSHHFWDEVRHSQFGAVRLKELGEEPDVCNPILFEQSEGMPVLHRLCYLTLGLEAYFMPRKEPRVREYESRGDTRSQLFADQDWNDEITHVRYGRRWLESLLENDFRTKEDIQEEVKAHLERVTGQAQDKVSAPF